MSTKGIISHRKGTTLEEEYGKVRAKRIRKKKSESAEGNKNSLGIKHKDTSKMGAKKGNTYGFQKGAKHPNWKGGMSFKPYSVDWTETLRRSIREREHYICQKCSQYGNSVHHIDYDKENCNPKNLINLCKSCNTKVNKNRNYWQKYFNQFKKS